MKKKTRITVTLEVDLPAQPTEEELNAALARVAAAALGSADPDVTMTYTRNGHDRTSIVRWGNRSASVGR